MDLTTERSVGEHAFRTNVHVPQPRAAGVRRGGAALGSCEGAAAGPRDGAAPVRRKGAATKSCGEPAQNLTFKIKFPAANICSKFEKFCQIFSTHPTSCIGAFSCVPANRKLIKREIFIIIYIESEREIKKKLLRFRAGFRNK